MRRWSVVPLLLGVLLASTSTVAPAQARPVGGAVAQESAAATVRTCSDRRVNPRKKVAAKLFGTCVVKGMRAGRTAHLTTNHDGEVSAGPMRFTKTTDASVVYQDGARFIVIGDKAWHKPAGKGWFRARKNGNADERLAYLILALWRSSATPAAYRSALASSTTPWEWTGKERRVNGVRAKEYTGTPAYGGATFSKYRVWLSANDRPVRIVSTGSMGDVTVTTKQDFRRWGKKVTIKPPKMS